MTQIFFKPRIDQRVDFVAVVVLVVVSGHDFAAAAVHDKRKFVADHVFAVDVKLVEAVPGKLDFKNVYVFAVLFETVLKC